jgi:membrane protein YdbS with pleckstrin-like domain
MAEKLIFENKEIDIQGLPSIEDIHFNKIEKKYLWVLLTRIFIPIIIINSIGIYLYVTGKINFPPRIFILASIGINALFLFRVTVLLAAFKTRAYALREKDITYQLGLLVFKQTTVSVNRIQHIELNQSFLMKLMNLCSLKIYTAGGSQSDLSIAGITKEKGEEIKAHLTTNLSQHE